MSTPLHIAPRWIVLPVGAACPPWALPLHLDSGPGFGDGSHPTTQLCLEAIAALAPRTRGWRLLDVGSGSGILSLAGARLGGTCDAVEIDAEARAHAARHYDANGVADRVRPLGALADAEAPFDLVVANVWRAVLLELALPLARLRRPFAHLLLSGLVSTDVPEVAVHYTRLLEGARPEVYERGDWRALLWRGRARA